MGEISLIRARAVPFPVLVGEDQEDAQRTDRFVTDEDAMVLLRGGDASALTLLFDRYAKLVFSIGLRVIRDHGEAEDIVQEVFTYLYQKAGLFAPERASAKSWIVRIAFHRALNRRYYLTKRKFYCGTDVESLMDILTGEADQEHKLVVRLTARQLQNAFSELSEKQRLTLQLVVFEGMAFSEIAEKINEPVANVRHHYYRGRERLRKVVFAELREKW
jgi:RNA polymerase sigma-70 factor, ECF subfamily